MPPRHAPDDFDAPGQWADMERWLSAAVANIRTATLGRLAFTHPADREPEMRFSAADPTTAWVIVAAARRPAYDSSDRWASEDADDVLYVGLLAQSMDGTWQGLAGMYAFGAAAGDRSGRRRINALRQLLPEDSVWVPAPMLPPHLAATDDWFEERLHGAFRLPDRDLPGHWASQTLRRVHPGAGAVLVRLGPTHAALHNVVFIEARAHVRLLIDSLSSSGHQEPADRMVSVRHGSPQALRALAGGMSASVAPVPVTAPTRFAGGWVVARDAAAVAIKLPACRMSKALASTEQMWTAARLSADSVVDWSATVRFAREVQRSVTE